MNQYTKIDDNIIAVTITKPAEVLPAITYEYGFLKQLLADLEAKKVTKIAYYDSEILRVQTLIYEAGKLGITEKLTVKE